MKSGTRVEVDEDEDDDDEEPFSTGGAEDALLNISVRGTALKGLRSGSCATAGCITGEAYEVEGDVKGDNTVVAGDMTGVRGVVVGKGMGCKGMEEA